MNEEIKDIFNEIKHLVEISNYKEHYHLNIYFEVEHIDKLLNYITNLQKENEHKDKLIDIANAGISYLQKENQKLNKIIDELEKHIKEKSIYYNTSDGCQWVDQFKLLDKLTELKKEVE